MTNVPHAAAEPAPSPRFSAMAPIRAGRSGLPSAARRSRVACHSPAFIHSSRVAVWLLALLCSFCCGDLALAQIAGPKVAKVEIKHVGPVSVSDALIRANIRIKPGDTFFPAFEELFEAAEEVMSRPEFRIVHYRRV